MSEIVEAIKNHWATFTALAAAVGVIAGLITNLDKISTRIKAAKQARKARKEAPEKMLNMLNRLQEDVTRIDSAVTELSAKMTEIDRDTGDLLCSQITRERDYYTNLGFCPDSDKRRLGDVYKRYKSRGRNHVSESYIQDIESLPSYPGQIGTMQ